MITSDYTSNDNTFDEKVLISDGGVTSLSYRVCKEGKLYFMKQLRPELFPNYSNRALLYKEFELGQKIENPYVVKYHDICESDDELYILMEYVQGVTIEEKLTKEKGFFANEQNLWNFTLQLLEGLKAFHSKGIAYIDISPNNIMLTQVGNNVKIVDMGFCFSNEHFHILGSTKNFTAPELNNKAAENIDERTDIYAVGCLLRYIKQKTGAKYSRLFYQIIKKCTRTSKEKRYATIDEMILAIKKRNSRRNLLIALIAVLVLMPVTYYALIGNSSPQRPEATKTTEIEGVIYKTLSHDDRTCEVVGGRANEEANVYIHPEITFDNKQYITTSIADSAFYKRKILSVYIPEGIKNIGNDAFGDCDSIVSISLPSTVKNIEASFRKMKRLKAVKISPEIKSISNTAFVDCISLTSVYIPEGIERMERDAFGRCSNLKNVSLPQSLKVIERGVFWECSGLEEITIPANVTEIGDYAFYHCDNLKHIYLEATTPPLIATIVDNPNTVIHVPAVAFEAYREHPNWMQYNIIGDL